MEDGDGGRVQDAAPGADGETGEAPRGAAGASWDEVGRSFAEFGDRIADVVLTASRDPEARRRLSEVQARLSALADALGEAVDRAGVLPETQRIKERAGDAARAVAEAGRLAADEAAPHVASALRAANEALRSAVDRLEEHASASGPEDDRGAGDGEQPGA